MRRGRVIGLVLALVVSTAMLVGVGSGGAAAADFGGGTAAAPNATFGCEAGPRVADAGGNFGVFGSGVGSCTWLQLPTYGANLSGGAPVSGRVTSVAVRSGPNPAPLRFTVVRIISGVAADGKLIPNSTQCCFGGPVSGTVRLRPNAVTQVPLNLPVVNRIDVAGRVAISDFVGISAASGQGTLPVRMVLNRPPNTADYATPGMPQVSMHYPQITPGQVRTDAVAAPAHLLTMRFTMCTAGQSGREAPAARGQARRADACGARIKTKRSAKAKRGKVVRIPLRCIGSCAGTVQLKKGKRKLGAAAFSLGSGGHGTVKVRLNKAGKRAVKGARTAKTKVIVVAQGTRTTKRLIVR